MRIRSLVSRRFMPYVRAPGQGTSMRQFLQALLGFAATKGPGKAYFDARNAGDSARNRRQWREAAQHYERALQLDGSSLDIAVQLGHAYKEMGLHEEAGVQYVKVLRAYPQDDDIHLQIGHLEKLKGNPEVALEYYLKAATINENNKDAVREYEELSTRSLTAGREAEYTELTTIEHGTTAQSRPAAIEAVDVSSQVKTNVFVLRTKELERKLSARLWS
jgi:tetratricopeptide (TPR) repeat protein